MTCGRAGIVGHPATRPPFPPARFRTVTTFVLVPRGLPRRLVVRPGRRAARGGRRTARCRSPRTGSRRRTPRHPTGPSPSTGTSTRSATRSPRPGQRPRRRPGRAQLPRILITGAPTPPPSASARGLPRRPGPRRRRHCWSMVNDEERAWYIAGAAGPRRRSAALLLRRARPHPCTLLQRSTLTGCLAFAAGRTTRGSAAGRSPLPLLDEAVRVRRAQAPGTTRPARRDRAVDLMPTCGESRTRPPASRPCVP